MSTSLIYNSHSVTTHTSSHFTKKNKTTTTIPCTRVKHEINLESGLNQFLAHDRGIYLGSTIRLRRTVTAQPHTQLGLA